jgi:hypothetical protein
MTVFTRSIEQGPVTDIQIISKYQIFFQKLPGITSIESVSL